MPSLKQIMIHALRSDVVVRAAHHAAALAPHAVFHVVSVVPTHRSRYPLNSLISNVFRRAAEEAVHEVELALMERGVLAVRKAVLVGRPREKLLEYVRSYGIDLAVLTASAAGHPSPKLVGGLVKGFAEASPNPVMICTPRTGPPPKRVSTLAVFAGAGHAPPRSLGRLTRLLNLIEAPVTVRLLCRTRWCQQVREALESFGSVAGVEVEEVSARAAEEVLRRVAGCDVLALHTGGGLKGLGEALAALSPAPTVVA